MPGERPTWTIRRFDELDSTNRFALDRAREHEPEGLVVVADHQTAGRGRVGRSWEAPPGSSLLVSVLLRRDVSAARSHALVMAAALALAGAVEEVAGVRPGIKWPNDLVVGERKLAGLLAERLDEPGDAPAVVVGAGLNVAWDAFPPGLADTATACNLLTGDSTDRDTLLDAYLSHLAELLELASEAVVARYRSRLVTIGTVVRVERPDGALEGVAVDIDDRGELLVRDGSGTTHTVVAGDVLHVRPA